MGTEEVDKKLVSDLLQERGKALSICKGRIRPILDGSKIRLTEFAALLPFKYRLSFVHKNPPNLTLQPFGGSMKRAFRKVPI